MHENREISASPDSSTAGRPEKALSRTSGAHGVEGSDCVVVPMNQPNKGGSAATGPTAEGGEGRTQAKENIGQDHTQPAQDGRSRVSQGLAGVRQAAKERKEERFTALLHHLPPALLQASFYDLKREAAPGVDGVRWKEYEEGLAGRIADLHSRIHRGAYRAQPSRRVYIPKADGRMHDPLRSTGEWLQSVVRGYFQYYAVPGNTPTLNAFRFRLVRLWRHVICRRSQKHPPSWERLAGLFRRWLPQPHVLHPYPHVRFDAMIQGRSRMR